MAFIIQKDSHGCERDEPDYCRGRFLLDAVQRRPVPRDVPQDAALRGPRSSAPTLQSQRKGDVGHQYGHRKVTSKRSLPRTQMLTYQKRMAPSGAHPGRGEQLPLQARVKCDPPDHVRPGTPC